MFLLMFFLITEQEQEHFCSVFNSGKMLREYIIENIFYVFCTKWN